VDPIQNTDAICVPGLKQGEFKHLAGFAAVDPMECAGLLIIGVEGLGVGTFLPVGEHQVDVFAQVGGGEALGCVRFPVCGSLVCLRCVGRSGFLNLQSGQCTEPAGTPVTSVGLSFRMFVSVGAARAKEAPRTMLEMAVNFILNWKKLWVVKVG
jgi:hypothetical protein